MNDDERKNVGEAKRMSESGHWYTEGEKTHIHRGIGNSLKRINFIKRGKRGSERNNSIFNFDHDLDRAKSVFVCVCVCHAYSRSSPSGKWCAIVVALLIVRYFLRTFFEALSRSKASASERERVGCVCVCTRTSITIITRGRMCCCIASGCPCSSWLDREFYIHDDGFIQYKRDEKRTISRSSLPASIESLSSL